MKKGNLRSLKIENTKLTRELNATREALNFKSWDIKNSLSGLVNQAFMQENITSFNPLFQNNIYAPLTLNWTLLTYMYKTHGIIQTAIDVPVLDALRGGLDIQSADLDSEDIKDLEDFMEENGVLDIITEALFWTRLYGGGAIIINTDQDPAEPLDVRKMKKLHLYAANRWELGAAYKNSEYYEFYNKRLHHSRVMTIGGKAAPYIIRWQLAGWGMSEVERMVEDFNKYLKTNSVLYELLEEAKIDVYSLAGFKDQLISQVGTTKTVQRIQLMNELKNLHRAIVMDKEDEYMQKQLSFAGIADIQKENRIGLASSLRMPMTKLFGLSASGFNSGEDDIENYNGMVESEVRRPIRRPIRNILRLLVNHLFGEDLDIGFDYHPLRVLSAKEEEEVKTSKQNRIMQRYDRMLLTSEEAAQEMEKEGLTNMKTAAAEGLLDEHPVPPQGAGEKETLPGANPQV